MMAEAAQRAAWSQTSAVMAMMATLATGKHHAPEKFSPFNRRPTDLQDLYPEGESIDLAFLRRAMGL